MISKLLLKASGVVLKNLTVNKITYRQGILLVLDLLAILAKRSDNTLDDEAVAVIKATLTEKDNV